MYLFFGDERKTKDSFSMVLFGIKDSEQIEFNKKLLIFKMQNNLPQNYEFHYKNDSRNTNQNLINLIKDLEISPIYYTKVKLLNEPTSHIIALNQIIPQIANDFQDISVRFVFDKLGGKKTEAILKTEINRLCRQHSLKQSRNVKFADSKNSSFIQIADYLVAMIDKGLL